MSGQIAWEAKRVEICKWEGLEGTNSALHPLLGSCANSDLVDIRISHVVCNSCLWDGLDSKWGECELLPNKVYQLPYCQAPFLSPWHFLGKSLCMSISWDQLMCQLFTWKCSAFPCGMKALMGSCWFIPTSPCSNLNFPQWRTPCDSFIWIFISIVYHSSLLCFPPFCSFQ